jgi:hypothetical protein
MRKAAKPKLSPNGEISPGAADDAQNHSRQRMHEKERTLLFAVQCLLLGAVSFSLPKLAVGNTANCRRAFR